MAEAAGVDVVDVRFTGLDSRETEPWYITGIRTWIVMANAIRRGVPGIKPCDAWAKVFEADLKRKAPRFVYAYYRDWNRMVEAEMRR